MKNHQYRNLDFVSSRICRQGLTETSSKSFVLDSSVLNQDLSSRGIAEIGIYPAVDPLDSKVTYVVPSYRWTGALRRVATAVQKILQDYKSL